MNASDFASRPVHHGFARSAEPKLALRPQEKPSHSKRLKAVGRIGALVDSGKAERCSWFLEET
jgi:hypothetical protein